MLQAHAQAVIDLFPVGLTPLDGVVPQGTTLPYALVSFRMPTPDVTTDPDKADLSFDQTALTVEVTCHSVATTAAGARAVATRVRAALLNVAPVGARRATFPL